MAKIILRFYLIVRKPRNFLKLALIFICTSLVLHFTRGYDADWGATNLILSIDATIAGAVMLMVQESAAEKLETMLDALVDMGKAQEKTLKGVLLIAEAQRDALIDHSSLLRTLRESDERILKALTGEEQ
jgi:hypothetical protein